MPHARDYTINPASGGTQWHLRAPLRVARAFWYNRNVAVTVIAREFLRYAVVGGIAFLADFGVLVASEELLLKSASYGIYVATVLGFMSGLTVNYLLSLNFVFTQAQDKTRGRSVGAFVVFGVVGILGLLWTELGMWIGVDVLEWNYMIVKIMVAAIVLAWNYGGRKLLVFSPKGIVR